MKFHSLAAAIMILAAVFPVTASGEDPVVPPKPEATNASLHWSEKNGVPFPGRFIRLSGDALFIDQDGRELTLSLSRMTDESARQARKLANVDEPPEPQPVHQPMTSRMQAITASRLQTEGVMERRLGPAQRKYNSARYQMGSPDSEPGREDIETEHTVWIGRDFLLKTTEVTWEEWNAVRNLGANYGYTDLSPGDNGRSGDLKGSHPVLGITWWDAVKWCNLLSQIENRQPVYYTHASCKIEFVMKTGTLPPFADWDAYGYRLPTEAEWEFACRPGTSKRAFHTGSIRETGVKPLDRNLDKAGWYGGNSDGVTHPVGTKEPNICGLYDMHGNAAEWCWDFMGLLTSADAGDPRGPEAGELRVIRGGSWSDPAKFCRAAYRSSRHPSATPNPFVGFRPALTLPKADKR